VKIVVKMADVESEVLLPPNKRSWYYTEVAENGEVVGVSEMYAGFPNAMRAAGYKSGLYEEHVRVEIERTARDDRQGA
jgi:hypothetical protein